MSYHPFADLIGLRIDEYAHGESRGSITLQEKHLNPNGVVHGAVVYALADVGMGRALQAVLGREAICATVEIKINYFKSARTGELTCTSTLVHRGRTLANLDSVVYCDGVLIAKANGTFAIIQPRPSQVTPGSFSDAASPQPAPARSTGRSPAG